MLSKRMAQAARVRLQADVNIVIWSDLAHCKGGLPSAALNMAWVKLVGTGFFHDLFASYTHFFCASPLGATHWICSFCQ